MNYIVTLSTAFLCMLGGLRWTGASWGMGRVEAIAVGTLS